MGFKNMENEMLRKRTGRTVADRLTVVSSLQKEDQSRLERDVIRYLRDPSPSVRAATLDVVGELHLDAVQAQVFMLLTDPNRYVRYSAVKCVGDLFDGDAIRAYWLDPSLLDQAPLVRMEALDSLVKINDAEALPKIVRCLDDADPVVRAYGARAIAQLNGKRYLKNLLSAARAERDDNARAGFAESLFLLGKADQFETLLSLLSSPEYLARCAAANALNALPLTDIQRESALVAVSSASRNALVEGDRSTMMRVEKELREQA
jgi:HEAT repeat protein